MRWDELIEGWTARLLADPALMALLGGNRIYPAQAARPVTVPSMEYLLEEDTESELFNAVRVSVDFWARGIRAAAQIERRLRVVTHSDVGQDLDGERVWLRYVAARSLAFPSDPGVVHRQVEFVMEAVRAR